MGQGWILATHGSLCGLALCAVCIAVGFGWIFSLVQPKPRREGVFFGCAGRRAQVLANLALTGSFLFLVGLSQRRDRMQHRPGVGEVSGAGP